jgi:Sulfotransferase domain
MMELIGAGMPRTGTLTQKVALEKLGLAPCYHWVDVLMDLETQVPLWMDAVGGKVASATILDGYRSCADWPGGYFYAQLLESHPQAKVLLSVRDPERWEPSFRETIVDMCHGESLIRLVSSARAKIDPLWAQYLALVDAMFWGERGTFSKGHSPADLIEGFIAHNEAVKRVVPPDQLLVWEVGDGWQPLCEFLGVPVPDEPLPHANDRATFLDRVLNNGITKLHTWNEQQEHTA